MGLVKCAHCGTKVIPISNGLCPACRNIFREAMTRETSKENENINQDDIEGSGRDQTSTKFVLCPKCQSQNNPKQDVCSECNTKLLPGRHWSVRMFGLILVIGGVLIANWLWDWAMNGFWAISLMLSMIPMWLLTSGLARFLGVANEAEKYQNRAIFQSGICPQQAIDDFSHAIQLAEYGSDQYFEILEKRGDLYRQLNYIDDARLDYKKCLQRPELGYSKFARMADKSKDIKHGIREGNLEKIQKKLKELDRNS